MSEAAQERNRTLQVVALYDYEPEETDELAFQQGDTLRVLRVQDDGWWFGYRVQYPVNVGLFPSNYVQVQHTHTVPEQAEQTTDASQDEQHSTRLLKNETDRRRIQQQQDPESLHHLSDGEEEELGPSRSKMASVLLLRRNLAAAERASEEAREARRRAERNRIVRRERPRADDREQSEEDEGYDDVKDDEDAFYPHAQGHMNHRQGGANDGGDDAESYDGDGNEEEAEVENDEDSSSFILPAAQHPRMNDVIEANWARQRLHDKRYSEGEEDKTDAARTDQRYRTHHQHQQGNRHGAEENAAHMIQRWLRRRRRIRRQRAHEQAQHDAAFCIQLWMRRLFAYYRWQEHVERERAVMLRNRAIQRERLQQQQREKEEEERKRQERRKEEEEERKRQERQKEEEEERKRQERQKEEERARKWQERRKETEELERRQQEAERQQQEMEERREQARKQTQFAVDQPHHSNELPSLSLPEPERVRKKVMKKEAIDLVKSLVNAQLSEKLRDQDEKLLELQRMVTTLQDVIRQQNMMIYNANDQTLTREEETHKEEQQQQPLGKVPSAPSLPSLIPTAPRRIGPSGIKPPRAVDIPTKLPLLANARSNGSNAK